MHEEHPELKKLLSVRNEFALQTNIFQKLDKIIFLNEKPADGSYVKILGLLNHKRVYRWINSEYIDVSKSTNYNKYKVLFPVNGSGSIGESIGMPIIGEPFTAHTKTFFSIGKFDDIQSAENCLKYLKTKFCRALFGILKITESNRKNVWKFVPEQDFSNQSDIDWKFSIADIDQQFYAKYRFNDTDIEFIEKNVRPME